MNNLPNLAGRANCDQTIHQELFQANIPAQTVARTNTEVPYTVIGQLGAFTFQRNYAFWTVDGPLPLEAARSVFRHRIGHTDCRAGLNAWSEDPDKLCELLAQSRDETARLHVARHGTDELEKALKAYDRLVKDTLESGNFAALAIHHYSVDSMQGLIYLADVIRALPAPMAQAA